MHADSVQQVRCYGTARTFNGKNVHIFFFFFEWQDTIQNAIFVIKNAVFVAKTIFKTKAIQNAVLNDKMPFKMHEKWPFLFHAQTQDCPGT